MPEGIYYDYNAGKYLQEPQPQTRPPGQRPPREQDEPDFAAERESFKKTLISKIGGHPYEENPDDIVSYWDKTKAKDHFNRFFAGRVNFNDRSRMSAAEREAWNNEVKRKHSLLYSQSQRQNRQQREYYDKMMGEFDKQQGLKMESWKRKLTRKQKLADTEAKVAEKKRVAAEKEKTTKRKAVTERLKDIQAYTDRITSKETPGYDEFGKKIKWSQGDPISITGQDKINKFRASHGLPPLVEKVDSGDDGSDIYYYEERKVPTKALEALKQNPDRIAEFEEYFGYRPAGY